MSRYIRQSSETVPVGGVNRIHHHVKTFVDTDTAALDVTVSAFLASLEALEQAPIIKGILFTMEYKTPPAAEMQYAVHIHYILVG